MDRVAKIKYSYLSLPKSTVVASLALDAPHECIGALDYISSITIAETQPASQPGGGYDDNKPSDPQPEGGGLAGH